MGKNVQFFLLFAFLIAYVRMEVVKFDKCSNHPDLNCNVTQVRVVPCAEAAEGKPCLIKRGKDAKIDFDFQVDGSYEDLVTKAYWASPTGDLPWIGMDTDGCSHTQCPTDSKPESFSYQLHIPSKLPARQYDVKWRLWKDTEMQCCFLIKIKLAK